MLMLKLRQARLAIRDGRLDEALALLDDRARGHRRGQDLVTDLISAFVRRGREHLKAGRPIQAARDAEAAAKVGGERTDVAALRSEAADCLSDQRRAAKEVSIALGAAREHVARGLLYQGEKMLKQVQGETRALVLMQEIDAKRTQLNAALQASAKCRALGDLPLAVRHACMAMGVDAADPRVLSLVAELRDELSPAAEQAFAEGRLDSASLLLDQLRKLSPEHETTLILSRAMQLATRAWTLLSTSDFTAAADSLREALAIFPQAKWIQGAIEQANQARDALNSLRTSALGTIAIVQQRQQTVSSVMPPPARSTPVSPVSAGLPARFVLQVDGAGSYLVFRQPSVTIGPVSSSRLVDLGLITEPTAPVATISRMDEDYFVRGAGIAVNDQQTSSKLLVNGDRISLGLRSRLAFQLPSPASTTAVIELAGARHPRADIRHAILLDREIVVSAEKTAHVRVDHASGAMVLHVRQDHLFVETKEAIIINGTPADRHNPIPLGAHVRVGNISFIVTNA